MFPNEPNDEDNDDLISLPPLFDNNKIGHILMNPLHRRPAVNAMQVDFNHPLLLSPKSVTKHYYHDYGDKHSLDIETKRLSLWPAFTLVGALLSLLFVLSVLPTRHMVTTSNGTSTINSTHRK